MKKTLFAAIAAFALTSCNPLGAINLTIEARNSAGPLVANQHFNKLFVIIAEASDSGTPGKQLAMKQYPGEDQGLPDDQTLRLGIDVSEDTPDKIEITVLMYKLGDPAPKLDQPPSASETEPLVASAVARATFEGGKKSSITIRAVGD